MILLSICNKKFILKYTYLKYKFYFGFFIFQLNNYDTNYLTHINIILNSDNNFNSNFLKKGIIKKCLTNINTFFNLKSIYVVVFYNNLKSTFNNLLIINNFIINYFIFNKFLLDFKKIKNLNILIEKTEILFKIFYILNTFFLNLLKFYNKINF